MKLNRSDIKQIISEAVLETLNEEDYEYEYALGKKWGLKDKLSDTKRDISSYPPAFQKGYKETRVDSFWNKMNDKLTNWVSSMGSSRLR